MTVTRLARLSIESKRSRVRCPLREPEVFSEESNLRTVLVIKISILRLTYYISSILFRIWGENGITIVSADNAILTKGGPPPKISNICHF